MKKFSESLLSLIAWRSRAGKLGCAIALLALVMTSAPGCSKKTEATNTCSELTGTPWVPNIPGVSSTNHDSTVTTTQTSQVVSGPLVGLSEAAPPSKEVTVSIDMSQDLGAKGSLTLVAEVQQMPSGVQGGAWPMLVYLSDGTNDLINLPRSGTGGDCRSSGYFTCTTSGDCTPNTSCAPTWPSAYPSRAHWQDRQLSVFGFSSVNTFPTCNWSTGSVPPSNYPTCAFNSNFFASGKLRTGTYTAKYVLVTQGYTTVGNAGSATFKVTAIKKSAPTATPGGGVDINVVLVGNKNIQSSRSDKGKANLDLLFSQVGTLLGQSGTGVKIGSVNVFEWNCQNGGDAYADVGLSKLGQMFKEGSATLPAKYEGKALNVFLVSTFVDDSGTSSKLTLLGLSGGLPGPPVNSIESSGLAFASFNKLDQYNPSCSGSNCPLGSQESAFNETATTMAHEIGHYFGLNHPSERDGTAHDPIDDTPICTAKTGQYILIGSCLNADTNTLPSTGKRCNQACTAYDSAAGVFCPTVQECQFNHLMWWTTKNFKEGSGAGDGNLISPHSGVVVNYSPFVQ